MALRAGWLNRRIQVYRPTVVDDGFGKVAGDDALVGSFFAAYAPVSDAERGRAEQTQATLTARFLVRRSTTSLGIDETCSLTFEGRRFGIAVVKESLRWNGVDLAPREALEISATTTDAGA